MNIDNCLRKFLWVYVMKRKEKQWNLEEAVGINISVSFFRWESKWNVYMLMRMFQ